MGRDAEISWYRTILCSLKTGRKYFGSLLNSQCEKTNEKTLCKVLGENAYKHRILHLWRSIRCCLCGPSTKHSSSGSLKEKQVLILYFLTDEHCGTDNCRLCTKSYQAKENISTSSLDITLSRALLKGVFAKSLTDTLLAAIEAITNVRNTAIHMAEEEMENFEFDNEWLTLKKNLVIICEHLNKPTEDLEDELESYYRLFNSCESCSKYMEVPCAGFTSRLTDASDDEILKHFKTLNDCPDCKGIQEGCHDARSLFLDNLPLFMGLHPDEFLPDLKENEVLSEDEYAAIEIPEERVGQMGVFISIMTKKSLSEFRRTLDILSAKDYGSKIREMRKDKKRKIHYSVGSDVKDTRGFQNDKEDTNMEQHAAAIEISFTGQGNGVLEKKTEEILHRDSFSSALKDMGPSDFETTKGSVIIRLKFESEAGYDKFCKAAYNDELLEYMSALWDRIKTEEPSACQDAMIMVLVKNLTDKPQGLYTLRGKTGTSSSFIDANHDYLIEELNPRPLMKQLKEDGYDTTNVCKIRKDNPFDRRSQALELLKILRQVHWHYLTECFQKTQPKSLRKKMNQFISSKEIKLPSSSKHMNEETDVFRSDSSPGTKEVKVRNLPPATSEESLKEFLQQETSVKIETVALDSRNKAAIVTLQSPKDTDVLMKSIRTDLTLSMRGKRKLYELEFEAIASESESESEEEPDDMISDTIYLSDLPSGTTEKKLKTFLERMSGSGTVQSLNYNAISHSAQVTFTSHDCVKTVMSKVPLKFQKMLIGVSYYETDVDKEIAGNEVEPQWIEVKDIPSDVTESQLRRFFEKDDISNGGKVESCYYNDRTGHAYIAFTEPAAITCVIRKRPIRMKDITLRVEDLFIPESLPLSSASDYSFTCRISELPKDTTEKELQAFFFKGTGFDRPEVELHEEFHVAFLTVKDFKAAAKILQKEIYDLKGTKIKAERYVSELDEDNLSDEYVPQQVVRISQLPLNVSAEDITRYFSNKRLSGGGPIMNLKLIPILQKAYIQFQLKQDADEIIKRKFHTVKNGNVLAERTDFLFEDEDEIETREMSCTIVVRVGSDTVTQDFLDEVRSYFDNESLSGGTELQTVDDVSTDEILLTYRNTKVAQDVATRSHIVGERKLNVELYRPTKGKPKVDEQHILLSELPSACTCEDVKDFVHSNVKRVVQNVRLQIENSMAIVRFMDGIDIATALENIRGKCLKQKVIRVDALPRTSSIQVTGFVEEIQELQVKKYFENETESGGGDIVSIEFLQEDMSYIVTFENHNVLSRLHQTHVLNGEVILVQPFFECLKETPSFKKPDETQIPCDADIYDFLFKNEKFKEELSMSVTKSCFGKIKWKSTPASSITVECILEKSVPNCRNIAKTWEEDVTKLAKAFLEKFDSFTFTLLQEVWDVSFTKLGSINKKEDVVIEMKKHDRVVSVYGVRAKVRELAAELRKLIQDEEEKIEHKKKSITETLQLRKSDLFLLQNSDSMNEITKKMSISEAGKDTITVKLTGNPKAVQESVEEIKVFLKGIYHAENTRISMLLLDFLETKRAKSHLNAILIENKVTCYWERRNASVHIFGADRSSTDKFMKIFDEVFEEMCYEIPTDSVQEFRSTKWEKYSEELKSKLDGDVIFCYLDTFVVISGIRGKCNRAREEIIEYGRRNTKIKATLTVEKHISRYLEIAKPLATIENRCTLWLDTSKHMLTVEETKENIKETTDNIDEILSAVKVERYQVRKPGIAKFLLSTNGKKLIDEVAESNKVSISEGDSKGFKSIDLNQPQIKAQFNIKSKPSVIILEGDLFRIQAYIFDNMLDVGIACLFKKYGGNKLVRDCREFSRRNMLLEEDVYMGEAGDLKWYKVMHAVRPQWHGGDQKERHILVNLVYRCLEEAAENGYKSIAFPPLCVGKFAFPDVVATSSMIKGINEFLKRKGSFGSLSIIFVIGNNSLVVDYFIEFLREEFPSDMVYIPEIHKKPSWEQEKHETCKENVVTFGSISIEVKFGSILEQEVEAIVNTTGLNADLSRGFVSRALLHRGGEEIQRDLKRSCIRPLKFFDIVRTSGGKLKIKNILHGVLPPARNEENARENIQNFVTKCLEEADDANVKTLAFPALGTGKLGYPEKIVAEKMFEAIKAFSERHKKTSITKVKFVIYEEDIHVLMIFKDIEKQHHSTSNESPFTARVRRQLVNDKTSQGLEKKETHEFSFETVSLVFTRSNIISSGGDGTRVVIVDSDFNLKGKEHIRKGKIVCAPAQSSMQYKMLMYVLSDDAENDIDGTLTDILREVQISQTPCITLAPFAAVHDFVKCLLEKTYAFCNETKQELKIIVTVDNDMDLRQAVDEVNQSNMSNKGLRRGLIEQNPTPKAQYPSRREPTMHESIVTLLIVGESLDSTQNARSSLDAKIRAAYTQKTIDDNIISTLSEEQLKKIEQIAISQSVMINVRIPLARIHLDGLERDVLRTKDEIKDFLKSIEEDKKILEDVQWYFVDMSSQKQKEYDEETNIRLERAHNKKESAVELLDENGEGFVVDLRQFIEYSKSNPSDIVRVKRREKSKDLPRTWTPMNDDCADMVLLEERSLECKETKELFYSCLDFSLSIADLKIFRIQNPSLFRSFEIKKNEFQRIYTSREPVKQLWHGTTANTIQQINRRGFNRNFCGKNATSYGEGVYFAKSSSYSIKDKYSVPDENGYKYVYLCDVLVGKYTKGSKGLRDPPAIDERHQHIRYDSVVDREQDPSLFVIFHDTQAYPKYLIKFRVEIM